ncbi:MULTISPECIES: hypothetical protein [Pseudoalteromonas]|uniref:ParB/Sulfiredoxin domain-containing protein n=1 Tax=Pseudoalteromonas luteoviolacea (strain 2ta16) TaxID=1353533 RepID=V4JCP7_PSEL2|nr:MULTISPECIES: hypothetical protein [Pseudoalteromonas]ESP92837.1 hypothetical protein PL2TA16_04035 [Pseudoalteromonas luteoviolacea 2ta16]KZN35649.1 hypothetical protein N483_01430 [Pseudoalteromonas luteoviolacea NCIMB 1944]MCG7546402.1 hypothetical protein [Pseudoalteromonas sp. Of7M-16]
MFSSRDDLILATLSNSQKLHSESFEYKSLFLNLITPDETNARFLPCVFIENEHARLFVERRLSKNQLVEIYEADGKVIIGKDCIINCLKYGTSDWRKANQSIESIIELGENISVSEIIQVPTVYPLEDNQYQILTGHRRFFALIYTYGLDHAAQFKVYDSKPLLYKVKQFQENASREDLPQYGKLQAFLSAMLEIEGIDQARLKIGEKKLTVREKAKNLGVSMGAFDNYNVLTRYPEVIQAYEDGLSASFVKVKKIILECEQEYKTLHDKKMLGVGDKREIGEQIAARLFGKKPASAKVKSYNVKKITQVDVLKKLLFVDVSTLDTNIDWGALDWDDHEQVNKALEGLLEKLS